MTHVPRLFRILTLIAAILVAALPGCTASTPPAPTAALTKPAATTAAATAPALTSAAAPAPATTSAPAAATTAAPASAAAAPTTVPAAKVVEYTAVVFTDASGPTVASFKPADAGRKAAFAWWNDTVGKQLGIKINPKFYDMRFDPTVVASLWPGALAEKPLFVVATGSAEMSAIGQRLATDKVPMYTFGGGSGVTWKPDLWVFNPQATYVHNMGAFINWRLANWKENRPLRVGMVLTQQVPSVYEVATGWQTLMDKNLFGGKVETAGIEYSPNSPTDLTNEVKRLLDKKSDQVHALVPAAGNALVKRALASYKSDAKVVLEPSSGFQPVAQALGSLKDLEGDYQVGAFVTEADTGVDGYKVYQQYVDKASGVGWQTLPIIGMVNALIPLRAVERAAKAVGPDKLTGQTIYEAMYSAPFESKSMLGLTGDIQYGKDAAFPTKGVKSRIATIKDGTVQLATPDWVAAPDVPKW